MMKDRWGPYQSFTGHEAPGHCFWCGAEVKNRRYCCEEHQLEYYKHFCWFAAVPWCLERFDGKCVDCGGTAKVVHHIEPLNGELRSDNIKNRPENLVALCYSCHRRRHARPAKEGKLENRAPARDRVQAALEAGQLSLLEV